MVMRWREALEVIMGQGGVACPKPEKLATTRARKRRLQQSRRRNCRAVVFARDHGRCTQCHIRLVLTLAEAAHEFQVAHIHETVMRSQGGDPTNPDNCVTLCYRCHQRAHRLA